MGKQRVLHGGTAAQALKLVQIYSESVHIASARRAHHRHDSRKRDTESVKAQLCTGAQASVSGFVESEPDLVQLCTGAQARAVFN